jgi:hypothetical protein
MQSCSRRVEWLGVQIQVDVGPVQVYLQHAGSARGSHLGRLDCSERSLPASPGVATRKTPYLISCSAAHSQAGCCHSYQADEQQQPGHVTGDCIHQVSTRQQAAGTVAVGILQAVCHEVESQDHRRSSYGVSGTGSLARTRVIVWTISRAWEASCKSSAPHAEQRHAKIAGHKTPCNGPT